MKFWASFIIACLGLITAFFAIFDGSIAAIFNFGTKYLDVAVRLNQPPQYPLDYDPAPASAPYVTAPSRSSRIPERAPSAVQFQIANTLSDGQLSEMTKVHMGDPHRVVGEFHLTTARTSGRLTVRGESGAGEYPYSLDTQSVIQTPSGTQTIRCRGGGTVFVRENATFIVHLISFDPVSGQCVVGLKPIAPH